MRAFMSDFGQLSPVVIGVLTHEDLVFWIATEAGAIAAATLTRPLRFADGTTRGGVDELLLAPQRRNRGIGRKLMEYWVACSARARASGWQLVVGWPCRSRAAWPRGAWRCLPSWHGQPRALPGWRCPG